MIYAMSDIHGCMDEFIELLEKIQFSETDTLFIVGDVIDRGPDPIRLLRYIMNSKNIHLLMGNHEEMMLNCLVSPYLSKEEREDLMFSPDIQINRSLWIIHNGGEVTANQYNQLRAYEQREVYDYLNSLEKVKKLEVIDKNFLLVHGGPDRKFKESLKTGKFSSGVLWERIEDGLHEDLVPGFELITGHTPTVLYGYDYAGKVMTKTHKYLIDCGCVFGYTLGCICLDTGEIHYVDSRLRKETKP